MATNHTSNYQLHLWEPGDSFLREEFNENSKKVDQALGELQTTISGTSKFEKLISFQNMDYTTEWVVDVSGINFSQWQRAYFDISLRGTTGLNAIVRANRKSSGYYLMLHNGGSTNGTDGIGIVPISSDNEAGSAIVRLTLEPGRDGDRYVNCRSELTSNPVFGYSKSVTFSALHTISFLRTSGGISKDSTIVVWGER